MGMYFAQDVTGGRMASELIFLTQICGNETHPFLAVESVRQNVPGPGGKEMWKCKHNQFSLQIDGI